MDNVCRECEVSCEGEATVTCAGPCGATFHRDCVGETGASARWTCPSCALKVVRCALCGEFELEESADRCLTAGCARAACSRCAPADGAFDCGGHACGACGAALGRGASTVKCVRCPKAFCRGCRPGASVLITVEVMKCVSHVKDVLPILDKSLLARRRTAAIIAVDDDEGGDGSDDDYRPGEAARDELRRARKRPAPDAADVVDVDAEEPEANGFSAEGAVPPPAAEPAIPKKRRRGGDDDRSRRPANGGGCFRCGMPGHIARDCPQQRGGVC